MRRAVIITTIGALLVTGCSVLQPAPADDTTLHLLDARPMVAGTVKRDLVLAISAPRAAPGFESAAIIYVQKAHALERYASHRWADTPARMLGQLLMRTIEDSGVFRAVVQAPNALPTAVRLDTEIVQLRQSFLTKPSRVELTLRVQLVDVAGRRVLATHYIEVMQDASSDDAAGGVAAANDAVGRALAQVAAFCVSATAHLPPVAAI